MIISFSLLFLNIESICDHTAQLTLASTESVVRVLLIGIQRLGFLWRSTQTLSDCGELYFGGTLPILCQYSEVPLKIV